MEREGSESDFNSHTREGVTHWQKGLRLLKANFNSHTREGVTDLCIMDSLAQKFQLTHP